jgi:glycosyltransferase involved in cell wall biosynthesis
MKPISVVIVCRNEADIIGKTLQSLQGLSDDIVVYDNGSNDGTMTIAEKMHAKVHTGRWEGYGKTKNKAIALARYDWILSLDADEAIEETLKRSILSENPEDERLVYEISFKNFFGNKALRFGEWGHDKHIRLFNRKYVQWNDADVHEQLVLPKDVRVKKLPGFVLHYTMKDKKDFRNKMTGYAGLSAARYFRQGKKAGSLKRFISPVFSFIKNYIFRAGFLDGRAGFTCARMNAYYTGLKYKKLKELYRQP